MAYINQTLIKQYHRPSPVEFIEYLCIILQLIIMTGAYLDAFTFVFEEIEVFEDRPKVVGVVFAFLPGIAR